MQRFLVAMVLVLVCATCALAGAIEEATSAYRRGDYAVAELLYRPLAEQGDLGAQLALSQMYFLGRGVPKDNAEGLKWVRKAAEHSGPRTQWGLGLIYEYGGVAPQDYKEAVKWYRRAAEQGDASGQRFLAMMYANGKGVRKDYVRAYMWYHLGTAETPDELLDERELKQRDNILSRMSPAQIEKAQDMARRCEETRFKECD